MKSRCVWLYAAALVAAHPTWGQGASQAESAGVSSAQLLTVLFSLVFVVALIFGMAWLVRKLGMGGGLMTRNTAMSVVATMPIGTRERLVIVDVAGQQLLLGVTAQSIQALHVLDEPIAAPDKAAGSAFSEKLMAVMAGKGVDTSAVEKEQGTSGNG